MKNPQIQKFAEAIAHTMQSATTPEEQWGALLGGLQAFEEVILASVENPSKSAGIMPGYMEIRTLIEAAWAGHKYKARIVGERYLKLNPNGTFAQVISRLADGEPPLDPVQIRNPVDTRREFCIQCRTTRTFIQDDAVVQWWRCPECKHLQIIPE